jgi:serine/threonine protein kinase
MDSLGRITVGATVRGLRGTYHVDAVHGDGSFGIAFAATVIQAESGDGAPDAVGQPVVLKELRVERLRDWKSLELFEREARVLAAVSHPRIPAFHELFVWDGAQATLPSSMGQGDGPLGSLVLVQQRAPGEPLSAWLERGEKFPQAKLAPLLRELLEILSYLHERTPSVVHRDIHPGNVLVDRDGRPFLVDFGAIQAGLRLAGRSSTFVGTAGYMPPEQILGAAVPASDLYALGMTLLTAAAGVPPAEMPIDVGRSKVRVREVLRGAPKQLVATIDRLVEPLAKDRIATAKQARALLDGTSARRSRAGIVASILVAAGAIGASALYVRAHHGAALGYVDPPPPVYVYHPPLPDYFGRAYLLDANSDDAADVLGHSYTGDYFVVDGKSGARLWTAHAGVDWFTAKGRLILGWKDKTFVVHAFDSRAGEEIWSAQLSDTFSGADFGDGCVVVQSADKRALSLDARSGTAMPGACAVPPPGPSAPYESGGVVIMDGDHELVFADEGPGTPRTSITRRKSHKVIWTQILDMTEGKSYSGSNVRRVGAALLIVGKRRSDPAGGFILARLDAATGELLKSVDVPTTRSIHAATLLTEGRLAVVANSGAVYAFDVETLEQRWKAGRTQ